MSASALLAVVLSTPSQAAAVLLDFGTKGSPLQKGFVRVTDQSVFKPGVAAGWLDRSGVRAGADPIRRKGTFSVSRGTNEPPPVYLTELSCDHVLSNAPAVLRVALSVKGAYRVWALFGPGGGSRAQVWDVTATAGDSQLTATLAGPWDCRVRRAHVTVRADHLDIRFDTRNRWVLNALVIAPESEWNQVEKGVVATAERAIFQLPPELLNKWKVQPRVAPDPKPRFTDAETKRGVVLYHRHYLDPIWPESAPRRSEIAPTLKAFAAWDEYEPLTLAVYPLGAGTLKNVTATDLVSSTGARIPADGIDVRWVRYMPVRPNYRVTGVYYRAPDVLMPWRGELPLTANESLRLWFTVYVGPATPDDVYRGEIRCTFAGGLVTHTPLLFRVAGIKLEKDRSLVYGTYYHHPYGSMFSAPDAFSRQWWRKKAWLEHLDMAAHGNNTVVLGLGGRPVGGGKWRFDFDRLGQAIDLCRRVGFYQPLICHFPVGSLYWKYMKASTGSHLRLLKMPPDAFFAELTEMVRTIEAERRRRQWPELLYYPIDEPSTNETAVRFMTGVMKAIKRVPGVRTYVTADPAHEAFAPMRPHVDVWCCQPFSLSRETVLADMKKRGVEYWCYPNHVAGENDHTPVAGARMTYGFGFWRSGFRALTPWIYQAVIGNPWNYLDGGAMDFFNRTDDDASPIPVTLWEAYREGIDDGRYVTTLDRWIDRARAAGRTQAAQEAKKDRDLVWTSIPIMEKYKYDAGWSPETYDVFRWLIADRILKLKTVLGQ